MTKEKHLTILAILYIAKGAIVLLVGLTAFGLLSGIGAATGDPTALAVLGTIGTVAFLLMFVLGLPGVIGGIGLLNHQPWARILVLVLGFLHLIEIPIGTALGIYTIWVLMDDEAQKLFVTGSQTQQVQVSAIPRP